MLNDRNNICSLQSQASQWLQSAEELIHERLRVLTAGRAARGRHPLNVNRGKDIALATGTHINKTILAQTCASACYPQEKECLCEDLCPASTPTCFSHTDEKNFYCIQKSGIAIVTVHQSKPVTCFDIEADRRISVCVCVVHVERVLKGAGRHGNASLETRGWLPWKPQAESSAAGRLREKKER